MALTTLLDYKTAVAAVGFDRVTDAAVLLDAINEGRQTVADERRWSWLEAVDSTTMVLAYDTPSEALVGITDLNYVDAVRIETGTEYYAITYLTPQDLRDKEHTDRTPDVPIYWTHAAGQIRVWPSPDKAYTLAVDYVQSIAALAVDADADTNIPPAFKALVKWAAAKVLAVRLRDPQLATMAESMYQTELRRKTGGEAITQRQTSQQVLSTPKGY